MNLVVGATGQVGGRHRPTAPRGGRAGAASGAAGSAYEGLVSAGADPVTGDLKDRPSLDAACAGGDAVVTTANSAQRGGADEPVAARARILNVWRAARPRLPRRRALPRHLK